MVGPHLFDGRGGKESMDDGDVDTSLLKHSVRPFWSRGVRRGKRTGDTSTTFLPSPAIPSEFWGRGIEFLKVCYDPVLEVDDVFRDLVAESGYWHIVGEKRMMSGRPEGRDDQVTVYVMCIVSVELQLNSLCDPG